MHKKQNGADRTMNETITISRAEYEELMSLRTANSELEKQVQWLMEQLRLVRVNKFGSKADTASEEAMEQLSMMFDEPEATEWVSAQQEKTEPVSVSEHTRTRRKQSIDEIVPEDIPVETEEHRLPEEQQYCDICGSKLTEIGKTIHRTLKIVPAQVFIHEDVYYTYSCETCKEETDEANIVKTPHDASVLPGSYASPEAIAHIMTQKYVMGVPLYRQEQDLKRRNIRLSRQTMSNWVVQGAQRWLKPVYEELHRQLLQEEILHADETELQVLHEPGKAAKSKSYMWLYRTGKYAKHHIALYEYQPDRKQEHPKEFLQGFRGYLQTDGYAGYNAVENVIHVGCLAHIRRKFTDAEKAAPKGTKSPTTAKAVAYCTQIFMLEEQCAELSAEDRFQYRQERIKPLLDEFESWASTRTASAKTKLGEALTYLHNQFPKLRNYLLDGRLEASNNAAERSIKPFVLDRKNFLFANTPNGAESSAVTFSLIETAKENGLDPYRYLTYIFKTAPSLDQTKDNWVHSLLPENVPASCKVPSAGDI